MPTKFLYWFMGDRAARVLLGIWNWLWGIPIESGGQVAVAVAQESLRSMQESVAQLAESVAQVTAAYQQAKATYETKQREFREMEKRALLAHNMGNPDAARMAMTQAIIIEQLLPQLAERVTHAEEMRMAVKNKLDQERQKLEAYKIQMQNLKALAEVNEALTTIAKVNTDLSLDSARSQFSSAEAAVQKRHYQANALSEISQNPAEKLAHELDQLTLDDQINQRLKRLEESSLN